ncbi:MAG: nickel pincer cofactor biosynthesis protein LarC [Candidatus Eisenbacteria bacterium]|nr:nickel pincer cofactor biosynthesis protein LarC [Candidatus Eisenbacteria bacterium]
MSVRIGYLDCVGGVSGDMLLGALLDAGWPEARLRETVAWLGPEIGELRVETRVRLGFRGLGIVVEPSVALEHHHRRLRDVLALIDGARLAPAIRFRVEQVFHRMAEAEGAAHGKDPDDVRFHEVGAVDAVIDVVGTVTALADLDIQQLFYSALPLGSGQVPGAHGPVPLPAPATMNLLRGSEAVFIGQAGERTTPTGAALVSTLGTCATPPPMVIEAIGTGAGSASYEDRPNISRLFVGRAAVRAVDGGRSISFGPDTPWWGWDRGDVAQGSECEDEVRESDLGGKVVRESNSGGKARAKGSECPGTWRQVVILETQIDDATPQDVAYLAEKARNAGSLDVFVDSIHMKKGRTAFRMTVVCRAEAEPSLARLLLDESTTLGLRRRMEWRRELERITRKVDTRYGPVEVKFAKRQDRWTGQPEFESCRRAAEAAGVPLGEVHLAAREAARDEAATQLQRNPKEDSPAEGCS